MQYPKKLSLMRANIWFLRVSILLLSLHTVDGFDVDILGKRMSG
jgi:hypothetical protein